MSNQILNTHWTNAFLFCVKEILISNFILNFSLLSNFGRQNEITLEHYASIPSFRFRKQT